MSKYANIYSVYNFWQYHVFIDKVSDVIDDIDDRVFLLILGKQ